MSRQSVFWRGSPWQLPSLRVRREKEIFWETTGLYSAWLLYSELLGSAGQHVWAHGRCQAIFPYSNIDNTLIQCRKKKLVTTCILLAQSTTRVVSVWLPSLGETGNSCAGSKQCPHHLMHKQMVRYIARLKACTARVKSVLHTTPNKGCHNLWAVWRHPTAEIWPLLLPVLRSPVKGHLPCPPLGQLPHRANKKEAIFLAWKL